MFGFIPSRGKANVLDVFEPIKVPVKCIPITGAMSILPGAKHLREHPRR